MNINPVGNNILVRIEKDEKTKGGIIIPEEAHGDPEIGTVVAVGGGRLTDRGVRIPSAVKIGDRVIFSKYAKGDERWDTDEFLMITEWDLFGVIESK